ncbi:hypothetical protein CoNPh10_CDS0016 [Staphylococcus phage S-CoN_Ph10]|nr:hypothetical protein CoNPh4_CDS0013 [Staphylococcus phage S-CoN_Ph4]WNM52072.1 hypothetical protein CoNPh5_CDS0026 [Staphylococcus phage S-CoN_Ph5]WNM52540.1 hypothetical protein CoNPh7_CDS0168 [Staphylococcus phage S-CoN_Ph7]WNM52907.1 hypothetical protein CoNPh10_CDS0016 [Staphylococcus phage S-CoN_Ph10]WNM53442.1 hypothetical protein CoNPh12_CDS0155 [Staphylococcus phage S-CoN_Ph12]WNM53665.1 hypothetical protein CoNPh13_CDS0195 [Staphylococcus phage S-CoN_Ph13]
MSSSISISFCIIKSFPLLEVILSLVSKSAIFK